MIKVITNHPLAAESDDHKHPEGIYYDNNMVPEFVDQLLWFASKDKINFMDLGCAGGALVCEMHRRGHNAVGLEGSDHCLNIRLDMVKEVGMLPAGYKNWEQYGNKILFTCDVTKDYQVTINDEPMLFDIITCMDVMEHFNPDEIDNFLTQVSKHLKIGGTFVASIDLHPAGRHVGSANTPEGLNYHKSVFPVQWWREKLDKYLTEMIYPFTVVNREIREDTFLYTGKKV